MRLSVNDELERGPYRRQSLFLDVTGSKKNLQVALVIDGTDSMDVELESVRKNLAAFAEGLRINKGDESTTSFAIVIYRDEDAPSGKVTVPLTRFTEDVDKLVGELKKVKAETGEPYFNELADVGLHTALSNLNWAPRSEDKEYTRWIVMCGDAAPYPKSARKHSDEQLVELAKSKGVAVYGILCNSGFLKPGLNNRELLTTAESLRPKSREFLSALAQQTGGKFLDLWDQTSVDKLINAANRARTFVQKMKAITTADVKRFQEEIAKRTGRDANANKPVKIAVIPPTTANESTSFESTSQSAMSATQWREYLRRIPGVSVSSPVDVEMAFKANADTVKNRGAKVRAVAKKTGADYVIWGAVEDEGDDVAVTSDFYSTLDGALLARAKRKAPKKDKKAVRDMPVDAAPAIVQAAAKNLAEKTNAGDTPNAFTGAPPRYESVSSNLDAQESILAGLDELERSLAYRKFEEMDKSQDMLERAEAHLKKAVRIDKTNAFAHMLLASCYYNLGRLTDVDDYTIKKYKHLELAHNYGAQLPSSSPLRKEIEADYNLLVRKSLPQAIAGYESLSDPFNGTSYQHSLRANWMLAGIYLGDFDVAEARKDLINLEQARKYILRILAHWPNSPEAAFYQKCIDAARDGSMDVVVGDQPLGKR